MIAERSCKASKFSSSSSAAGCSFAWWTRRKGEWTGSGTLVTLIGVTALLHSVWMKNWSRCWEISNLQMAGVETPLHLPQLSPHVLLLRTHANALFIRTHDPARNGRVPDQPKVSQFSMAGGAIHFHVMSSSVHLFAGRSFGCSVSRRHTRSTQPPGAPLPRAPSPH